jgi:sterol desaturase/sphingolipid hydroxylase (fatty acid hydroxylase superfamily)
VGARLLAAGASALTTVARLRYQNEARPICLVNRQAIVLFILAHVVLFAFLVRALVFTTLEKVWPARPHSYRPTILNDLTATAAYVWVVVPLAIYFDRFILRYHRFPLDVETVPIPLRLVLYLVVADFGYYWVHRLMHTRYVWRVHMWHHSPPLIYWLAGMRATVPQQFLVNLPYFLMYPILGAVPWWVTMASWCTSDSRTTGST